MQEYHYIRYHFVRRSDCTYIIYHGPSYRTVRSVIFIYNLQSVVPFWISPIRSQVRGICVVNAHHSCLKSSLENPQLIPLFLKLKAVCNVQGLSKQLLDPRDRQLSECFFLGNAYIKLNSRPKMWPPKLFILRIIYLVNQHNKQCSNCRAEATGGFPEEVGTPGRQVGR